MAHFWRRHAQKARDHPRLMSHSSGMHQRADCAFVARLSGCSAGILQTSIIYWELTFQLFPPSPADVPCRQISSAAASVQSHRKEEYCCLDKDGKLEGVSI